MKRPRLILPDLLFESYVLGRFMNDATVRTAGQVILSLWVVFIGCIWLLVKHLKKLTCMEANRFTEVHLKMARGIISHC